ncbi:MAG: NAD-dependent epimerase/dehydratase family protein [Pseudomonadota bacterium]
MSRIVVTGAGGFIGRACVSALIKAGHEVAACLRHVPSSEDEFPTAEFVLIPDLARPGSMLETACHGAEAIIHLADNPDRAAGGAYPGRQFADSVARAATVASVPRIIHASSIYARLDTEGQANAYGAAKREAESVLSEIVGSDAVILRLPPVYGPCAKGGVAMLSDLVRRGLPLPFGSAKAPRDYLALGNLTALLTALVETSANDFAALAEAPHEPNDGASIATADLASELGRAMGKPARLLPFPRGLLLALASVAGKKDQLVAALDPLAAGSNNTLKQHTNWNPVADWTANLAYLSEPQSD